MRKNEPKTPLLALLRQMTGEQREQFAKDAGTPVSYLYSLASCQRAACSAALALDIENASRLMAERTAGSEGATPIVTMQTLATMCTLPTA